MVKYYGTQRRSLKVEQSVLCTDVDRSVVHTQDQGDGPQILKAEVEDAIQHTVTISLGKTFYTTYCHSLI